MGEMEKLMRTWIKYGKQTFERWWKPASWSMYISFHYTRFCDCVHFAFSLFCSNESYSYIVTFQTSLWLLDDTGAFRVCFIFICTVKYGSYVDFLTYKSMKLKTFILASSFEKSVRRIVKSVCTQHSFDWFPVKLITTVGSTSIENFVFSLRSTLSLSIQSMHSQNIYTIKIVVQ